MGFTYHDIRYYLIAIFRSGFWKELYYLIPPLHDITDSFGDVFSDYQVVLGHLYASILVSITT
jgi:hypothetical protein